jgi:hypothetical protein
MSPTSPCFKGCERRGANIEISRRDVRFWHKADMNFRNVLPFQPARLTKYDALSRASVTARSVGVPPNTPL